MPIFLAAPDLVALPQRANRATMNQVPGKVFEAMAMAKPILATAVSGLPEIPAGVGRVVAPGSVSALAEALHWLLDHPGDAAELGSKARLRRQERYTWDAMDRILAGRLQRWQLPSNGDGRHSSEQQPRATVCATSDGANPCRRSPTSEPRDVLGRAAGVHAADDA